MGVAVSFAYICVFAFVTTFEDEKRGFGKAWNELALVWSIFLSLN